MIGIDHSGEDIPLQRKQILMNSGEVNNSHIPPPRAKTKAQERQPEEQEQLNAGYLENNIPELGGTPSPKKGFKILIDGNISSKETVSLYHLLCLLTLYCS